MANPWPAIVLALAIFMALMVALKVYAHCCSPHPELVRKLLHIGMGLVALSFPWVFDAAWPVVLLAGIAGLWLLAVRRCEPLRHHLGSVLGGVARESWGEIYFALAVALLFVLAQGDALLFCVPMLILTLADAVGALIGVRYGQRRYRTAEVEKSVEGSLAFFIMAFLSTLVPLLLFTEMGRAETLLIALTLGLLVMLLEAIAWQGLDNLFIPPVSFILLRNFLKLDVAALTAQFSVAVMLTIFALAARRRTTLDESAMMGAALAGYVCWALGGWRWLTPPLILFLSYILLSPRGERGSRGVNIHAVVCVTVVSLIWLFLYSLLDRAQYFYPYTLAFASHLSIIGLARLKHDHPQMPAMVLLGSCTGASWLLLFVPLLLLEGFTPAAWAYALAALAGIALAASAFYGLQPGLDDCPTDAPRWLRQTGIAAIVSILGVLPVLAG